MIKRFARSEHTTRFMSIDEFDDAAAYLSGSTINIADGVKLQFYALFKQASIGPCNVDRPSFFDFVGKAKWDAWHELGALPAADAKQRYVDLLTQIVPDWQRRATAGDDTIDAESGSSGKKFGSFGGSNQTGMRVVSTMMQNVEDDVAEADQDLFYHAQAGDIAKVQAILDADRSLVNSQDADGRTALHWAVDREHHELAELLLTQYSANANIQDVEGQTCLHVACVCEHFELIRMLRAHGADPHVADASGETPLMLASNNTDLLTILQV